jgi:hypothetical protein
VQKKPQLRINLLECIDETENQEDHSATYEGILAKPSFNIEQGQ